MYNYPYHRQSPDLFCDQEECSPIYHQETFETDTEVFHYSYHENGEITVDYHRKESSEEFKERMRKRFPDYVFVPWYYL